MEIERVLIEQVTVLETMTPNDFLTFRDRLMPASGFQSAQFRCLEFACGLKDASQLAHHDADGPQTAELRRRLAAPSLGERVFALLERRLPELRGAAAGSDAKDVRLERLLRVYQEPQAHYDLYLLAEALIEFDEMFYLWRLRHIAMVERMIGSKPGTGGSEGVAYLRTTLSRKFFPELWEVRTRLSSRSS
jgi:tryptophan 2,3-dioxygenase